MTCPTASSTAPPALHAFTARLFELARTLELLHHTHPLRDEPLASTSDLLLRAQVRRLRHAYSMLEPDDRPEADLLLTGLDQRAALLVGHPSFAYTLALLCGFRR